MRLEAGQVSIAQCNPTKSYTNELGNRHTKIRMMQHKTNGGKVMWMYGYPMDDHVGLSTNTWFFGPLDGIWDPMGETWWRKKAHGANASLLSSIQMILEKGPKPIGLRSQLKS